MSKTLIITNGDSAIVTMQEAGIAGDILPWRDILHDGPVHADLSLEELSKVRAEFITNRGWGEAKAIQQEFTDRDNQLKSYKNYEKVVLWFEHDLYDQLQIIQILDWFNNNHKEESSAEETNLTMICTENYLGMISPDEMKNLQQYELPITKQQLTLATKAWKAFCSATPTDWSKLLSEDTIALPFLEGAVLRQLEEYPDYTTGLSRTAYQALKLFSQGETRCGKVFAAYNKTEERRFLGDLSFWLILDEMANSNPPLLALKNGDPLQKPVKCTDDLVITKAGENVLQGKVSFLDYYEIDRWIGGIHLSNKNIWCWNSSSISLVSMS